MAITDNIIFRLKAQSGQATPSSVVGSGETLTGGTTALVDLGGGVFAWKFTGAESLVTIPSKIVSTSADAGGVTLAITIKRVAYPTVSSQIMVGWTDAGNTAGMLVRRGSAVPEDMNCRALFSSQSSATKPSVPATTLQTYVMRLETKAASLQDVTKLWVQTTGRVGTSPDYTGTADNLTAQTITTIRVNPTNSGDYEIVDLVLWGRELTDAEAAAVADDLRGVIDASGTAPSITTQPSNASVAAGATATFTAAASGSPTPTYQWQRNPGGVGTWADIAGATAASYTTPATTVSGGTANDGDTYRIVATNASGSATSTAATLTVSASNAAPTFPGPSISNLSISQGVSMTAVDVASKFSDTDALTFSAIGTWPAGVTVSSAGVISGTPTTLGTYTSLQVRATDTAAQTADSNTFSAAVTAVTATLNFQAAGMEFGSRTGLGIATFALEVGVGYRYTVHADGLTLGSALYTSGVVTTDSAGKLPNLVDASITAGVTYRVHAVRQSDGAAATFRMTAA